MKTPRIVRLLLGSLAFTLAFVAACMVIRRAFPFPQIPNVHAKYTHFTEHANDYNTLFIGTSRINYQVIPAEFDQLTKAAGVPTESFNAAVAAMRPPEDAYFLDQLLAARPQRLRWVFVELGWIRASISDDQIGTVRAQYWHDWPRLWLIWQSVTQLKPSEKKRTPKRVWREVREPLAEFPQHAMLFLREMTNLGRGDILTRQLLYPPIDWRPTLPNYLGPDLAGWVETSRGEAMTPENQAMFEKERADRLAEPAKPDFGDPVSQRALDEMIAKIERSGATPVIVIPPITSKKTFAVTPERARRTMVLDFNDLQRYPELYENKHRIDTHHLNTAGAKVFTRLLAERFIEEAKARGERR
jgi:hypothetical protein